MNFGQADEMSLSVSRTCDDRTTRSCSTFFSRMRFSRQHYKPVTNIHLFDLIYVNRHFFGQADEMSLSVSRTCFQSSAYVAGAVLGAIFFGWLTDRLGRKRLFFMTLAVYLVATAATALSWNLWSFALFRFFTGAGIGGEYAADRVLRPHPLSTARWARVPLRFRSDRARW